MAVDITGFERHRREQREKERKEKLDKALNEYSEESTAEPQAGENSQDNTNTADEPENATESQNEPELSVDEVKEQLKELGVKFAHNTSEEKLREKLADAIK